MTTLPALSRVQSLVILILFPAVVPGFYQSVNTRHSLAAHDLQRYTELQDPITMAGLKGRSVPLKEMMHGARDPAG